MCSSDLQTRAEKFNDFECTRSRKANRLNLRFEKMSKQNGESSFVVGLIVGGVVGTIAGMVLASRSNKQTRQILDKSVQALPELAEDLYNSVELQGTRLSKLASKNWDRFKDAVAVGIEASKESDLPENQHHNHS